MCGQGGPQSRLAFSDDSEGTGAGRGHPRSPGHRLPPAPPTAPGLPPCCLQVSWDKPGTPLDRSACMCTGGQAPFPIRLEERKHVEKRMGINGLFLRSVLQCGVSPEPALPRCHQGAAGTEAPRGCVTLPGQAHTCALHTETPSSHEHSGWLPGSQRFLRHQQVSVAPLSAAAFCREETPGDGCSPSLRATPWLPGPSCLVMCWLWVLTTARIHMFLSGLLCY